jgi:hypothetical protein
MEKDGSMKLAQSRVVTVAAWTNKIERSFLDNLSGGSGTGHLLYTFTVVDYFQARIEGEHVR